MSETGEKSKTKYFQQKSLSNISEMRAAKFRGLFPKKEGWRNVVEHEIVESEVCDVLAEMLNLSSEDRKNVNLAASLHDVNKRSEVERMKMIGAEGYEKEQENQDSFLRQRGYSPEVVELTNSVGSGSLLEFLEDPNANELKIKGDLPLPKLIIHYADDIVMGSKIVPLKERIEYLLSVPHYKDLNEAGRKDFNGRTAFEVQFEVSRQIEAKFAEMLGVSLPETLPEFIKGKIEERIKGMAEKS